MNTGTSPVILALACSTALHAVFCMFFRMRDRSGIDTIPVRVEFAEQKPANHVRRLTTLSRRVSHPDQNVQWPVSQSQSATKDGLEFSLRGESIGIHATYPRISRMLGEEGEVQIAVTKNGLSRYEVNVREPSIEYKRLEISALAAVQSSLDSGLLQKFLEGRESLTITFVFRLQM